MFVGHNDAIEIRCIQAEPPQTKLGLFQPKTAIEQHTGDGGAIRRLDYQPVALTAGTQ